MIVRRLIQFFVAGLLVAVAAGGVTIATGAEPAAESQPEDEFSVLETQPEGVSRISSYEANKYGAERPEAQTVPTDAAEIDITPGSVGVCLNTDSALTCGSYDQAESGQISLAEVCGPDLPVDMVRVSGLLPDGHERATLVLEDGTTQAVNASENAYSVDIDSAPVRLEAESGEVLSTYATSSLQPGSC